MFRDRALRFVFWAGDKYGVWVLGVFLWLIGKGTAWGAISCGQLASSLTEYAPVKVTETEDAKWAYAVWKRVYGAYQRYSQRSARLIILRDRTIDPKAPGWGVLAVICEATDALAGSPPSVYISHEFLQVLSRDKRISDQKEALLAFVFGHELAHRVNDFCSDGHLPQGFIRSQCADGSIAYTATGQFAQQALSFAGLNADYAREVWADRRGAFYVLQAGYTVRGLANQASVRTLTEVHFSARELAHFRSKYLDQVLRSFDGYEELYRVAVLLGAGGDYKTAEHLVTRLMELVSGGQPDVFALPELLLLRAQIRMVAASEHAPWPKHPQLRVPWVPARKFLCLPLFASHTRLYEEVSLRSEEEVKPRGELTPEEEEARKLLEEARKDLDLARLRGGDEALIAANEACVTAYLGEVGTAWDLWQKAERAQWPPALQEMLHQNRAFLALLNLVAERRRQGNPVPGDLRELRATLRKRVGGELPAAVEAFLPSLIPPSQSKAKTQPQGKPPSLPGERPVCPREATLSWRPMPEEEIRRWSPGGCYEGWKLASPLEGAEDLVLCERRTAKGDREMLIQVRWGESWERMRLTWLSSSAGESPFWRAVFRSRVVGYTDQGQAVEQVMEMDPRCLSDSTPFPTPFSGYLIRSPDRRRVEAVLEWVEGE